MKQIYIFALMMFSLVSMGQQVTYVGSQSVEGGANCFYFDQATNQLYVGGTISSVDGQAANWIAVWNGSAWTPVGNIQQYALFPAYSMVHSIAKANDTLYAVGMIVSTSTYNIGLHYFDESLNEWTPLYEFGFGSSIKELIVYNNTLYMSNAGTGYTLDQTPYDLGEVAYWNGSNFVSTNYPTDCGEMDMEVYDGKLYAGEYVWDGSTWETFGVSLNCNEQLSTAVFNNKLYMNTYTSDNGGTWNLSSWDGSTLTVEATLGQNNCKDMCSLGNQLAIAHFDNEIANNSTTDIGLWDGSTWTSVDNLRGSGGDRVASYNGQLIIGSSMLNEVMMFYESDQNYEYIGTVVKYGEPNSTGEDLTSGLAAEGRLNLYPNPLTGNTLHLECSDNCIVNLYKIDGTLVSSHKANSEFTLEIGNEISNGIYLVQIVSNDSVKSSKLVISR